MSETTAARQTREPDTPVEDKADAKRANDPGARAPRTAREQRIAELRKQHEEGTYEIDAEEVSKKIVDAHLPK